MSQICIENQIKFELIDYEFSIEKAKESNESKGHDYYRGAPVEEVLRFASVGTQIALQIMETLEAGEKPWASNKELAKFILSQLRTELGENYFWLREGFHFVCNPINIHTFDESQVWILSQRR
jgi:hypothetical protein